jgi:hypothetical protein
VGGEGGGGDFDFDVGSGRRGREGEGEGGEGEWGGEEGVRCALRRGRLDIGGEGREGAYYGVKRSSFAYIRTSREEVGSEESLVRVDMNAFITLTN